MTKQSTERCLKICLNDTCTGNYYMIKKNLKFTDQDTTICPCYMYTKSHFT